MRNISQKVENKVKFVFRLKAQRNILSMINLIIFLGSFTMISISGFSNSSKNTDSFHIAHHLSCKKEMSYSSSQLLIEENSNENESEDGFEMQEFFLPFLVSYINFDCIQLPIASVTSLAEKLTNPIYLAVCNFRI